MTSAIDPGILVANASTEMVLQGCRAYFFEIFGLQTPCKSVGTILMKGSEAVHL